MRLLTSLFIASMMLVDTPTANAQVSVSVQRVTRDGGSSKEIDSLKKLSDQEPEAMRGLYDKAKDPSMTLSSAHIDTLQSYGLLNDNGEIPSQIQNYLLSNVEEDEDTGELYINDPSDNYDEENYYSQDSDQTYYYPDGGGQYYYSQDRQYYYPQGEQYYYYPQGGQYYYQGNRGWGDRRSYDGRYWDRRGDYGDYRRDFRGVDRGGRGDYRGDYRGRGGGHRR